MPCQVPSAIPPCRDRDRQLRLRQGRPQMRRHVVGSLVIVRVERRILGRDAREVGLEIVPRSASGIFLDQQGSGSVAAEDRQQSGLDFLILDP